MQTKKAIRTKSGEHIVVRINRRRACRYMCIECMSWENIETCNGKMVNGTSCPLIDYQDMTAKQNATVRAKAIRKFCLDCVGGNPVDVSNCIIPYCPLYPYRNTKVDRSILFDSDVPDEMVLEITKETEERLHDLIISSVQRAT